MATTAIMGIMAMAITTMAMDITVMATTLADLIPEETPTLTGLGE